MLTDKQRIKKLEVELKREKKAHKKTKVKLRWKSREEKVTYKALMLRKTGMTWVKIAKKVKAPESTVRLATQKRYKDSYLRGRWSEDKRRVGAIIDERTNAMLADRRKNPLGVSYEEYIRQKY